MAIKQISSGGGEFTITTPASASNRTITLPDATTTLVGTDATQTLTNKTITSGTIAQAGIPAFRAYRSGTAQSLTTATWTKAQMNAESYDTASAFDSTTNYRFQPTVAGYYLMCGTAALNGTSITQAACAVYKNGGRVVGGNNLLASLSVTCTVTANGLVYLDGVSDYAEFWVFCSATTPSLDLGESISLFSGVLVRAA